MERSTTTTTTTTPESPYFPSFPRIHEEPLVKEEEEKNQAKLILKETVNNMKELLDEILFSNSNETKAKELERDTIKEPSEALNDIDVTEDVSERNLIRKALCQVFKARGYHGLSLCQNKNKEIKTEEPERDTESLISKYTLVLS